MSREQIVKIKCDRCKKDIAPKEHLVSRYAAVFGFEISIRFINSDSRDADICDDCCEWLMKEMMRLQYNAK